MNGTGISTPKLTCFFALAGSILTAEAATPDYFPLQTGNSWAYRITQAGQNQSGTINVADTVSQNGQTYFRLQFFDRDLLVRQDDAGSLLSYDPDSKQET